MIVPSVRLGVEEGHGIPAITVRVPLPRRDPGCRARGGRAGRGVAGRRRRSRDRPRRRPARPGRLRDRGGQAGVPHGRGPRRHGPVRGRGRRRADRALGQGRPADRRLERPLPGGAWHRLRRPAPAGSLPDRGRWRGRPSPTFRVATRHDLFRTLADDTVHFFQVQRDGAHVPRRRSSRSAGRWTSRAAGSTPATSSSTARCFAPRRRARGSAPTWPGALPPPSPSAPRWRPRATAGGPGHCCGPRPRCSPWPGPPASASS
jgi:hypothetical protein